MLNKFNFKGRDVTVVEIDGEPWWVAIEVIDCLGLARTHGSSQHLSALRSDEKRVVRHNDSTLGQIAGALFPHVGRRSAGGATRKAIISESGLYKLIMRSDKPEAREFQDWVTREVLPAIRRTGRLGRTSGERKPPPAAAASG